MAIITKHGLKFYDVLFDNSSESLIIESNRLNEYIDYYKKTKIKSFVISMSKMNSIGLTGYQSKNVDFLAETPNIERLKIESCNITDVSGIYNLKNLKGLWLEDLNANVDLSYFSELEILDLNWQKKIKGFGNCTNLKCLILSKFKPKNKTLEELSKLTHLEELKLISSTINSLKGLGELKKLKELDLWNLRNLEIIDEINENTNSLKKLVFENCRKIKNHDYVSNLPNLEWLTFYNCGEMPSIKFIKNLKKLKNFILKKTNVLDGDMTPCIGLEYVVFENKKHYSPKDYEIMHGTYK